MASLQGLIDDGVPPAGERDSFDLLPAGEYVGQIIESDTAPTSSGTGVYIKLTWELLNDGYKGRRVWQNINVRNESVKAQQIGQAEFAALKLHTGVNSLETTAYHNRPVGLTVGIEKSKNSRYPDDKNQVKGFFPAQEFVPGGRKQAAAPAAAAAAPAWSRPAAPAAAAPAAPAQQAAPPAPAQAATPPWMKKAA
jgi:hypothetical protein